MVDTLNNTILKKQNYLRNEIIEQGYDPDDFTNFLKEIKGEKGSELDSWTIEELYYVVPQFKESKQINQYNFQYGNEDDDDEINDEEDMWGNKIIKKEKITEINCKTIEYNKLLNNNTSINFQINEKPDIIKNGVFSFSYFEYKINVTIINKINYDNMNENEADSNNKDIIENKYEIKRSLNDFIWFQKKLSLFYPNVYIPPLPKQKLFLQTEESQVYKNIFYLYNFLEYLKCNEIIYNSNIFYQFITLNSDAFKIKKSQIDIIKGPANLTDLVNKEGKLKIEIIPAKDKKAYIILNDKTKKINILKKLISQFKELSNQLSIIQQKHIEIARTFEELKISYMNSDVFNDDINVENLHQLQGIFNSYSKGDFNQKLFIDNELKNHFKYMKKELKFFDDFYNRYNAIRTTFVDITDSKKVIINKDFKMLQKYFGYLINNTLNEYKYLHNYQYSNTFNFFQKIRETKKFYFSDYQNFIELLNYK